MDPKLYEAAVSGDLDFLRRALASEEVNVFAVTKLQKNTLLHIAAMFGQVEFCRELLITGRCSPLLLESNSKGESALHVASKIGVLETVKFLLSFEDVESLGVDARGKLLRMKNQEWDTALHVAVRNGHVEVAKYLMEADQELLRLVNKANASPICLAMEGEFFNIASFILENFPKSLAEDTNMKTTMLCSAILHHHHDFVEKMLKKMPESMNGIDQNGWTPLHYAALWGNVKSTELLLQGDRLNAYTVDQDGTSALHVAAFQGEIGVVKLLLQLCPDIHEVTDKKGRTLLHTAVINGEEKMVRLILKMPRLVGIVNEKDMDGNTALHLAVINKRNKIATLLAGNIGVKRTMANDNHFTAKEIFFLQRRKASFLTEKLQYQLGGTHQPTFVEELWNTNLKKEMMGETLEDRKILFSKWQKDEENSSTHTDGISELDHVKSGLEINLVIATLITTVTYQAVFQLPGGYKDDDHDKGTAQFIYKPAFKAFVIFNAIAFLFSISAILTQFATSRFNYYHRSRFAVLARKFVFIALLGMFVAFASGMYVELFTSIGLRPIAYIFLAVLLVGYIALVILDPVLCFTNPELQKIKVYLMRCLIRRGIY